MYNLYFILCRIKKRRQEKKQREIYVIQRFIEYLEAYYNLFLKERWIKSKGNYKLNKKRRNQKVIVSLTTFPGRINVVWLTIVSLMRQKIKPDLIILWLARSQFETLEKLPKELLSLKGSGLEIRFCDDLKSHKKYFYTLKEYDNDIVILVDDDMFYPPDTIKKLLKMHKKYPTNICTMSGQVITPSFSTPPSKWRSPFLHEKYENSSKIQIFSGSGSLYPPHCLHNDVFRKDLIEKLCPYADDLWLTFMALKNNTKITSYYPWRAFPISIYGTSENCLWNINCQNGQNDEQWKNILEYFNISNSNI